VNTVQRQDWYGPPVFLGAAWRLTKAGREAVCELWSHQLGWELRLMVGDLRRSQVCRSHDDVLDTQEHWKVAMSGRGWKEADRRPPEEPTAPPTQRY
jgi:hypothetical protein